MSGPGLLESIAQLLESGGLDPTAWGLAWARAMPVVAIIPAFGLRALSASTRAAAGLMLAAIIVPALKVEPTGKYPLLVLLVIELSRGVLVAVSAAVPLWAATMAGGVVDNVRGAQESSSMPTVEGRATPLGVLFSIMAGLFFLTLGGPSHLVAMLAHPIPLAGAAARAAADIAAGVGIAVALSAPLLAASIVVEVAGALVARAASPAHLHALLAPIRSMALLTLAALLLHRMAGWLALRLPA